MGKYLKNLNTHSEYESYIEGLDVPVPNVCICEDETPYDIGHIHYGPWHMPYDEIWYTSTDGNIVTPYSMSGVISNTYEDGQGVIKLSYTVTSLNNYAFDDRRTLATITLPDSVTGIGNYAFSGCSSMTSIDLSSRLESIGDSVFKNCSNLISVDIPDSVTSIGDSVFEECSKLVSVTLPDTLTDIGSSLFYNCKKLESANIPENITYVPEYIFWGCESMTSIDIPEGVTRIEDRAFQGCKGLTSLEIPDGVTSIGGYAFNLCSGLTSIDIPDGVTRIENNTFSSCESLTSIDIPDGVTYIGNGAFYQCSGISTIQIPECVTYIGYSAFESCSNLRTVNIPDGITSIGSTTFGWCKSLKSIDIPDSVTSIGTDAFRASGISSITLPENLTSIGQNAFYSCSSLRYITIPSNVTSIGQRVFYACYNLNYVICLSEIPPTCGSGIFDYDYPIYVLEGSVDEYKAATNLTAYSDRITSIVPLYRPLPLIMYAPEGVSSGLYISGGSHSKRKTILTAIVSDWSPSKEFTYDYDAPTYSSNTITSGRIDLTVPAGSTVLVKSTDANEWGSSYGITTYFGRSSSERLDLYGNIYSLVNNTETLPEQVFRYLFYRCNVSRAPYLYYSSGLSAYCYFAMFACCRLMTDYKYDLPSMTLYQQCYGRLFRECGMVKSPRLKAPTLASECYFEYMYDNPDMSEITCYAEYNINTTNLSNWLYGTASEGTFTKLSTSTFPEGNSGIPSGWTVNNI